MGNWGWHQAEGNGSATIVLESEISGGDRKLAAPGLLLNAHHRGTRGPCETAHHGPVAAPSGAELNAARGQGPPPTQMPFDI